MNPQLVIASLFSIMAIYGFLLLFHGVTTFQELSEKML